MTPIELGETINQAGRDIKAWLSEFMLVYSPIFVLLGMLMTGADVYLNGRLAMSIWFMVPWSIVQVLAVDGLWFAVWIRILTDEYKWRWFPYHAFTILIGVTMTCIAVVLSDIVFFQQTMNIGSSLQAMQVIGIPVGIFLHSRAILLVATSTLALVFDKVMRDTRRPAKKSTQSPHRSTPKSTHIPETKITESTDKPTLVALPAPKSTGDGYRDKIKWTIERYMQEGKAYTYQDIANETGAAMATVKKWAPKIKEELVS
jgi:hypothetical protein